MVILGPGPLHHDDASREGAAGAPLLGLDRLAWAEGGCCFEADGEGRAFPCEDLLQASFLRSGIKALREPYLSVVQERPGGCEAALSGYDFQWHRAEGSQHRPAHAINSHLVFALDPPIAVPSQLQFIEYGALYDRRLEVASCYGRDTISVDDATESSLCLAGLSDLAVAVLCEGEHGVEPDAQPVCGLGGEADGRSPTWMVLLQRRWLVFLEKRIASVLKVSKRTALLLAGRGHILCA